MSKVSIFALAALVVCFGPTFAMAGGMGDSSAHMRAIQAECDAQKRGEIPRDRQVCLPTVPNADGSATPYGR